jgi:hypothetical protein
LVKDTSFEDSALHDYSWSKSTVRCQKLLLFSLAFIFFDYMQKEACTNKGVSFKTILRFIFEKDYRHWVS